MPDLKQPPQLPSVSLDELSLEQAVAISENKYALAEVLDTYYQYEKERLTTEQRWRVNDALYCSYVPVRYWPNTKIERSSLGFGVAFEQIEGAYPMICQALFAQPDFFSLEAEPGSNPQAVRAQQAYLDYSFNYPDMSVSPAELEYKMSIKDMLLYGNGYVKIEFNPALKIPTVRRVDPRNLYIDPAIPGPLINKARSVVERTFLTVEQVRAFRADTRMNVPSDEELWALAQGYSKTNADIGKEQKEALIGNYYSVGTSDNNPLPTDKRIEVLMYYTPTKIIWILNRQWVLYKATNPYGFIPFSMVPCYLYTSSPYGISIADAQEANQRYVEGLLNSRLDYVNLNLIPPRFIPRSAMFTTDMESWGPGSLFRFDEPEKFNAYNPPDITSSIFNEISFIQSAADRKTGISSMLSGIPTPSNANRSATGVNAQMQGASLRLYSFVDNAENYLLIDSIQKCIRMARIHLGGTESVPGIIRGEENPEDVQFVQVSAQAFAQGSRVRVRAASKMLSRDRLGQMYGFIAQNILNGAMIGSLQQVGETIDFKELMEMLGDATGVSRKYKIIRQMTDQEKQQMQQAQQAQQQSKNQGEIQKAQMEQQTRLQMGQMKAQSEQQKNQTALQIAQMKSSGPSPQEMQMEQAKAQMDMLKKQKDIEAAEMKVKLQAVLAQIKERSEQQKLLNEQRKAEMEAQVRGREIQMKNIESQMNLQNQARASQMEQLRMSQSLDHERASNEVKLKGEKGKYLDSRKKAKAQREQMGKNKV